QSFYIVNAILVKGTRDVAETLAARPDVARVEGNPHIQNHLPQPEAVEEAPSSLQRPTTIELGINYTHAPQVRALGYTGQNIGMAPSAKWIGCRNMDANNGTPARYIECMQWFLAPTRIGGGDPDPTKAPDITNNSWECPPSEGCSFDSLQAAVEAQAAAGIMMVSAAQNSGPNCSTVQNPPGIYGATYTAGALVTGTDTIAGFSSRGPVISDGSGRIKPDISAPGTSTRSSTNASDSSYANFSGTSMATPHTAGAMALLWSAIPSLRHQLTASRNAINNSAVHIASTQCGDPGPPNNVYGWGRL